MSRSHRDSLRLALSYRDCQAEDREFDLELEYEMSRRSVPVHALPVPIRLSLYARSANATPGPGGGGQRQRSCRLRSRWPDRLPVRDRMSIRQQKQFRSTFSRSLYANSIYDGP